MTTSGSSQPAPDPGSALFRWSRLKKEVSLDDGSTRVVLDLGPLEIPAGRLTCVVGPSGCGKTTLLGILGFVDTEYEGDLEARVGEHRFASQGLRAGRRRKIAKNVRRSIGFVFQDIRLTLNASAIQNVIDPLIYTGRGDSKSRLARARECLTAVGIREIDWRRRIASFSGGMQQRAAIARAEAGNPVLICADEPTANLDDGLAEDIYADLRRIVRERGISVIVVTHQVERALRFSDHAIRIERRFADPHDEEAAIARGEWPFEARAESIEHEGSTAEGRRATDRVPVDDTERPSRLVFGAPAPAPRPTRLGGSRLLVDAGREALKEYRYLGMWLAQAFLFLAGGWFAALLRRLRRAPPPAGRSIPPNLFMPLLVAFLTFAFLSGGGFFFHGLREAALSYLGHRIDSLQALRRVRVEAPGASDGSLVPLDVADAERFIADRGGKLALTMPRFDLFGWALSPRDVQAQEQAGHLPPEVEQAVFGQRSVGEAAGAERLTLNLVGVRSPEYDPLADDLGLLDGNASVTRGAAEGELPGIFISRNEFEWRTIGGFGTVPKAGETLAVLFVADTPAPDGGRLTACVQFRVGGYFNPLGKQHGLEVRNVDPLFHGVMHVDAFRTIVEWQSGAGRGGQGLPATWACPGAPPTSTAAADPNAAASIKPDRYDFYAADPRDVALLEKLLDEYGVHKGITYGELYSESRMIRQFNEIINTVEGIGVLLVAAPVSVGLIVLWFVLRGILDRKREQLLIYIIMGARSLHLNLQCIFILALVALPALGLGYLMGTQLPSLVVPLLDGVGLPASFVDALRDAHLGPRALLELLGFVLGGAALVSFLAVRSLVHTNPSEILRGNA